MNQTLIARLKIKEQYDTTNHTIAYHDDRNRPWQTTYSQLKPGDSAIFLTGNEVLFCSVIKADINSKTVFCENVISVQLSNDNFLRLHQAYPETIARIKASFHNFIHPLSLDHEQLISDAKAHNLVNFYVFNGQDQYRAHINDLNENDRVTILDGGVFNDLKLHSHQGLIDFPKKSEIPSGVSGLTLDKALALNVEKAKGNNSNNVKRIKKLRSELAQNGFFRFKTFFSYYDTLINQRVYGSKTRTPNLGSIVLNPAETVYKISMSPDYFDQDAYNHFVNNHQIVVNVNTRAKGTSRITQSEYFTDEMKIGDYFYLCYGNRHLDLVGKIVGGVENCIYKDYGDEGWLQRSYEVIAPSIKTGSYKGPQKWWAPNDISTCIEVPRAEMEMANKELFQPFFGLRFINDGQPVSKPSSVDKEEIINLNEILYGPPGTGKTFHLTQQFESLTETGQQLSQEEFLLEITKDLTWWETLAISLYQLGPTPVPDLMKHSLVKARFGHTRGKIRPQRLWHPLTIHTVDECGNVKSDVSIRASTRLFYKEKDSTWRLADNEEFENEFSDLLTLVQKIERGPQSGEAKKRYLFTTCHQSLAYEDFIEGIKPVLSDDQEIEDETESTVSYSIEKGVFYNACDEAARLAGYASLLDALDEEKDLRKQRFQNALEKKRYFTLFLDEINRANIAATFGELITLLEADKRLGGENEIIIDHLPYSKKPFGIPPNLRVVGTMNTADRSVEALDAALRRRFSFIEMAPRYDLDELKYEYAGYSANKILKAINARIQKLRDNDHTIGHSYFIKDEETDAKNHLLETFYNKIIPLLQEYFFGETSKIGQILGYGFVKKKENEDEVGFAPFDSEEDSLERTIYEIIDYRKQKPATSDESGEPLSFERAIQVLMQNA